MRKSFLTATLLATAASYAAAPVAPSHSAEPTFDLSISGTGEGFVVYHNGKEAVTTAEDPVLNYSPYYNPEIVIDSNIVFNASMMYEGWKYGAYVRIDMFNRDTSFTGGSNDMTQGDSFYLSLGHEDMGTLHLGARPGASTTKWIWMPGAGAYSLNGGDATRTHGILTNGGELPWWSAKYNKVIYVSPDFSGFSFAASYTPYKDEGQHIGARTKLDLTGVAKNVIEVQGMFVMDGLKVSAGFANQDADGSSSWYGTAAVNNSFNVLASYSMDGLTVGAGYQTHPNFTQDKWTVYGGAQYAFTDDWSFGAGYLIHDDHTNIGRDLIVANVNYAMTKKASWNTGVTIPTSGDNWSVASGFVYKFGPNT